jgi:prepilin-type processing-associated H-X9-DG protein
MFCPKCGTEIPEGTQTCRNCNCTLIGTAQVIVSAPKTSGLAVASLILGVMSVFSCLITAPLSVILGIISLVKISQSKGQLKGTGMAVAGIAVPVVALPIVAILMAILMPALAQARNAARLAVCSSNLKQLDLAATIYGDKYGNYPEPNKWIELLKPFYKNDKLLICPGEEKGNYSYAMNSAAKWNGKNPDKTVLFFECRPGWQEAGGPEIVTTQNHYKAGCNVAFCDGHVQFVKPVDINDLKWTQEP